MAHRRRFGRIRKLPSGRWQARYPSPQGQLVTAATTFATKADAARFLASTETDMARATWFDPRAGHEPLNLYANRWVDTRRVKGKPLAPRTRELYSWQLRRHILPTLGTTQLRDLEAGAVRAWYAQLIGPAGPGASTAAKCYRLLRAICNTAVRDGELARSPCMIIGGGDENATERPAVSVAEVYAIADAVGPRWRALVLLAAFSGLRFGELAALTRDRLDLNQGRVVVIASLSELPAGVRLIGPPKSAAGRRTVAIPAVILPELQEHLDRYAETMTAGLLFVGPLGAPLGNANFGRSVWRPAVQNLGLRGLHFHDLRGCAATLAAISGATTAELMHRLGHSRPDIALRYQRATADRDDAVARALSELVIDARHGTAPVDGAQHPLPMGHAGGTRAANSPLSHP